MYRSYLLGKLILFKYNRSYEKLLFSLKRLAKKQNLMPVTVKLL